MRRSWSSGEWFLFIGGKGESVCLREPGGCRDCVEDASLRNEGRERLGVVGELKEWGAQPCGYLKFGGKVDRRMVRSNKKLGGRNTPVPGRLGAGGVI